MNLIAPLIGLWLKSYLNNRKFALQINNTKSQLKEIKAGIPQGGCISAHLFSIYINDVAIKLRKI